MSIGERTDANLLQRRIDFEITPRHPLFGNQARILGYRIDCDDVLVALADGTYANIHLTWGSVPDQFPEKYPHWIIYQTEEDLLSAMAQDAADYEH